MHTRETTLSPEELQQRCAKRAVFIGHMKRRFNFESLPTSLQEQLPDPTDVGISQRTWTRTIAIWTRHVRAELQQEP